MVTRFDCSHGWWETVKFLAVWACAICTLLLVQGTKNGRIVHKTHETYPDRTKINFSKNNLSYDLPWTFSCDVRLAADALVVRLEATPEAAIIVDVSEDVCFAEGEPAVVWTDDPWE